MGCCEHGDERSGLIRPQEFIAQLRNVSRTLLQLLCCNTICHSSLGARHVRHSSQGCREMAARPGTLATAVEILVHGRDNLPAKVRGEWGGARHESCIPQQAKRIAEIFITRMRFCSCRCPMPLVANHDINAVRSPGRGFRTLPVHI